MKKGEEVRVYSEDGEPANGWHQINGVFPLDFDELKIELSTVNLEDYTYPEDRNPVLAIEGIEVKGNLSVESLMESFQYNPPALPFSGKVKCNDDIEKGYKLFFQDKQKQKNQEVPAAIKQKSDNTNKNNDVRAKREDVNSKKREEALKKKPAQPYMF